MNISRVDIPYVLKRGDGKAGQSMQPITLYITVAVSANMASPILPNRPPNIPTEAGDSPAKKATKPSMVPDSGGPIQSTAPGPLLPPLIDPIGRSNMWERAVRRIKWVMNTLGPIAEVRVMSFLLILESRLSLSAFPVCKDGVWSAFSDPQGTSVCVIVRTRHSCYVYLVGRYY